jgi:hypothetical protein
MNNYFNKWFQCSLYMMKNFFPMVSRDKTTYSTNLEPLKTQHPSERIKIVDYKLLKTDPKIRPPIL